MKEDSIIVFLDSLGRTIIGKYVNKTETELIVKNPAIVNIAPQRIMDEQTKEVRETVALHLVPVIFKEFLADQNDPIVFNYKLNNITLSDNITLNFKVLLQYDQVFRVIEEVKPAETNNTDVTPIKLFDK